MREALHTQISKPVENPGHVASIPTCRSTSSSSWRAVRPAIALLAFLTLVLITQSAIDPTFVYAKAEYLFRPYDAKGLAKVLLYLATYALCVVSLLGVVLLRTRVWAFVLITLVVVPAGFNIFYQLLGNPFGLTAEELELMVQEIGQAGAALSTYADMLVRTLLLCVLVFALAAVARAWLPIRTGLLWLLLIPASVAGTEWASHRVGDIYVFYYPAPQSIGATLFERFSPDPDRLVLYARNAVTAQPTPGAPAAEHLLLLLDESINGDYLSLNGYTLATTPWLVETVGTRDDIVNFGVVNSVSNASAWSNLILRIGLQPGDAAQFDDRLATLPTVFQYAKAAGYETRLIDAQMEPGLLQNHLTRFDLQSIDRLVYRHVDDVVHERDARLLGEYLDWIDTVKGPTFTVFVRTGAHWPWADKYPDSAVAFSPSQTSTLGGMSPDEIELVTNTYANALLYNVDRFLERWIDPLADADVTTLYTADHGISLFEDGTPRTHGSFENVPHGQLSVPLMMFGKGVVARYGATGGKRFSQFQVFPTLLGEMGYGDAVTSRYGFGLQEPWNATRETFVTGRSELVPYDRHE